jgi:hypothetical protein
MSRLSNQDAGSGPIYVQDTTIRLTRIPPDLEQDLRGHARRRSVTSVLRVHNGYCMVTTPVADLMSLTFVLQLLKPTLAGCGARA